MQSAPQVLEKVVVPVVSRSSLGSSLSSIRDQSIEYDTPTTSVAVTPAESTTKDYLAGQRSSKLSRSGTSIAMSLKSAIGKRKRLEEDELVEAHSLLARALQENEYEEVEQQPIQSSSRRGRRVRVEDSEDDDPLSSSMPKIPSTTAIPRNKKARVNYQDPLPSRVATEQGSKESRDGSPAAEDSKSKRTKTTHRTTLPSRAARDSARRSVKDREAQRIFDREDSESSENHSDTSLFASNLDSDAFGDSGDSDEDVEDTLEGSNNANTTEANAATALTTTAPPAISQPRRRTRGTRVPNSNRPRRRWGGHEDRVSKKCLLAHLQIGLTAHRPLESVRSLKRPIQRSRQCGTL